MTEHNKIETKYKYSTAIWHEKASSNPFVAEQAFCHGYNVFEDLIHHASLPAYLLMMFTGHQPSTGQAKVLEQAMIGMSHPGLRDSSVRAAMNAGVGGSRAASPSGRPTRR